MRRSLRQLEPLVLYGGLLASLFATHVVMNGGVHLVPESEFIEAQAMTVLAKEGEFQLLTQDTKTFEGGHWTNDNHLFAVSRKTGQSATFQFAPKRAGRYRVSAFLTKSFDYGIVRIEINGRTAAKMMDLHCPTGVIPTGAIDLGTYDLARRNTLKVTMIGRNAENAPPHYQWAIDGVELLEVLE